MDLALVVDPEMLDEGIVEGGLAESGEARHLAFMAEGQESQGLGGIGIGLAQAVDAPGPLQLRLAAVELGSDLPSRKSRMEYCTLSPPPSAV